MKDLTPGKVARPFVVKVKWASGYCFCNRCYQEMIKACDELGIKFKPQKDDKEFYVPLRYAGYHCPHWLRRKLLSIVKRTEVEPLLVKSVYEGV